MTMVTANICGLGEAAAALIAQAVLKNPACLTVLSLAGNSLGLQGCVMLIEALHSTSTQISSLDIASNHISFVHQHKLELILDLSDVHTCDCCSLAGTQSVWRCELCNFDICPSCFLATCPFQMVAKAISLPTLATLNVAGNGFVSSALVGEGHVAGMHQVVSTLKESGVKELCWDSAQHTLMIQELLSSDEITLEYAARGSGVLLIAGLVQQNDGVRKMRFMCSRPVCDCGNPDCGENGASSESMQLNFDCNSIIPHYRDILGSAGFSMLAGILSKFHQLTCECEADL